MDVRHQRMSPLTELLLLEAARAQHVAEVIAPALGQKAIVLCDRFVDSSVAYQGYGRGQERRTIDHLNRIAAQGICPDLTIVLDLPVEQGLRRAAGRRRTLDRMERQRRQFHQRVRRGYLDLARDEPWRVKVLDGSQLPDVVQAAVRQLVSAKLRSGNPLRKPGSMKFKTGGSGGGNPA